MRWLGVAALVEGLDRYVGSLGLRSNQTQQVDAFYFAAPAMVVPLIPVEHLKVLPLPIAPLQFDPLPKTIHLRRVTLLHHNLHNIPPLEVFLPHDWDVLRQDLSSGREYLLAVVEVHLGMHLLQELLQPQSEIVPLLAVEKAPLHCPRRIVDADVDGAALGVEETDNCLENGAFGLVLLERQLVVLVLDGEVLVSDLLPLAETQLAPQAPLLLLRLLIFYKLFYGHGHDSVWGCMVCGWEGSIRHT